LRFAPSGDAQRRLLERAQHHGLVRTDLSSEDVAVALWSVHGVLDNNDAALSHRSLTAAQMNTVIKDSPSPASHGKPRQ
jgi:hypothetical protein